MPPGHVRRAACATRSSPRVGAGAVSAIAGSEAAGWGRGDVEGRRGGGGDGAVCRRGGGGSSPLPSGAGGSVGTPRGDRGMVRRVRSCGTGTRATHLRHGVGADVGADVGTQRGRCPR